MTKLLSLDTKRVFWMRGFFCFKSRTNLLVLPHWFSSSSSGSSSVKVFEGLVLNKEIEYPEVISALVEALRESPVTEELKQSLSALSHDRRAATLLVRHFSAKVCFVFLKTCVVLIHWFCCRMILLMHFVFFM